MTYRVCCISDGSVMLQLDNLTHFCLKLTIHDTCCVREAGVVGGGGG